MQMDASESVTNGTEYCLHVYAKKVEKIEIIVLYQLKYWNNSIYNPCSKL